jgi:hypothetical protein
MVDGDPGVGKSTMLLDIAARGSTGQPAPDGASMDGPWVTLYVTGEDDADDTIRPRLDAAGADVTRIYHLSELSLPGEAAQLRDWMGDTGARFVILDPIVGHLDETVRTNSDHNIRLALRPLAALAREFHASVAALRHLSKEPGRAAMYRGGGSIGFNGLARGVVAVGPDPDDKDRAILAPVKNSVARLGPSLAFRLTADEDDDPARVAWEGESRYTAEQVIGDETEDAENKTKAEKLGAAMLQLVVDAGGRIAAVDGYKQLELDGWDLSSEDLKNRARKKSTLTFERSGFGSNGAWYWVAPPYTPIPPKNGVIGVNGESIDTVDTIPRRDRGSPFCADVEAHELVHFTATDGRHCRACSPLGSSRPLALIGAAR